MKKLLAMKSGIAWALLAVFCIVLLSFSSEAAERPKSGAVDGRDGGPGMAYDGDGMAVTTQQQFREGEIADSVSSLPAGEAEAAKAAADAAKAVEAGADGDTEVEETEDGVVYIHDGVRYQKGDSWGEHRLTGYSAERNGTMTASGQTARAKHTVAASSELPLGTVLIVEGVSGPNASDYNGVYVVEDRGGAKVEEGLVDIFFQAHKDAAKVTDKGWNTVEVWIAKKA